MSWVPFREKSHMRVSQPFRSNLSQTRTQTITVWCGPHNAERTVKSVGEFFLSDGVEHRPKVGRHRGVKSRMKFTKVDGEYAVRAKSLGDQIPVEFFMRAGFNPV